MMKDVFLAKTGACLAAAGVCVRNGNGLQGYVLSSVLVGRWAHNMLENQHDILFVNQRIYKQVIYLYIYTSGNATDMKHPTNLSGEPKLVVAGA